MEIIILLVVSAPKIIDTDIPAACCSVIPIANYNSVTHMKSMGSIYYSMGFEGTYVNE